MEQCNTLILTGNSRAYYLGFFKGNKISYASSFGRTNITQSEIDLIKSELPHIVRYQLEKNQLVKLSRGYVELIQN